MKKTAVIVIVIAILGLIGIAEKTQGNQHQLVSPAQTSMASAPGNASVLGTSSSSGRTANVKYKDGTFTGESEFTPYGTVQIAVVVSGGKIADINFLQMPSDQPESRQHTSDSEPLLKQATITNQGANIDFVSGATDTSYAFKQSLQAALNQAVMS